MRFNVAVHSLAKAGMRPDENEDRASYQAKGQWLRAAVADGATESALADLWAESLVSAWVHAPGGRTKPHPTFEFAKAHFIEKSPPLETLPWYGRMKVESGAHAALIWLEVRPTIVGNRWRAITVGDCEMVVLTRGGSHLARCLPFARSREFNSNPTLVSSLTPSIAPVSRIYTGSVPLRGEIWLMSDALAQHCLSAAEAGQAVWTRWARAAASSEAFESAVQSAREQGEIRNDDVTLVRVIL